MRMPDIDVSVTPRLPDVDVSEAPRLPDGDVAVTPRLQQGDVTVTPRLPDADVSVTPKLLNGDVSVTPRLPNGDVSVTSRLPDKNVYLKPSFPSSTIQPRTARTTHLTNTVKKNRLLHAKFPLTGILIGKGILNLTGCSLKSDRVNLVASAYGPADRASPTMLTIAVWLPV